MTDAVKTSIHGSIVKAFTAGRRASNRRRLQNHGFSLLASNCTGGIIYHELGLRFTSPFINMQMDSAEFIQLVLNLKYYMKKNLRFYTHSEFSCPVATLEDLTLIFTHYHSEEEARQKWIERKERIDYGNLYVLTNDCGVTEDDIRAFEQIECKNKVLFTAREREYPHALYLKDYEGKEEVAWSFAKHPWTGSRYFERVFDYVGFLNSDNEDVKAFLR